jgi:co-chaperonin GroES (HSP10)
MKAIGRNLIITPEKLKAKKTQGGLILGEKDREDVRYIVATVFEVGDEVSGIKKGDKIYYDKHAGHSIDFEDSSYHVIKIQDVVVVL